MKYLPLFVLIQAANLPLAIIGIPVCAILAYCGFAHYDEGKWHWPKWAWLWDNEEDGVAPDWYASFHQEWHSATVEFVWTAFRNPVNNLRYIPGVSKAGRPLWYWSNGKYYAKAGWVPVNGWPVLSAGAGRGF